MTDAHSIIEQQTANFLANGGKINRVAGYASWHVYNDREVHFAAIDACTNVRKQCRTKEELLLWNPHDD